MLLRARRGGAADLPHERDDVRGHEREPRVCLEAIADPAEAEAVRASLARDASPVIEISLEQVGAFAGERWNCATGTGTRCCSCRGAVRESRESQVGDEEVLESGARGGGADAGKDRGGVREVLRRGAFLDVLYDASFTASIEPSRS